MKTPTTTPAKLPVPVLFLASFLATLVLLLGCPLHDATASTSQAQSVQQAPAAAFNVAF